MEIITTGCVTPMGNDEDTIWENILDGEESQQLNQKVAFTSLVSSKTKRRISRFSNLCLYATITSIDKIKEQFQEMDKNRVGAIFTTAYGPLEPNLEFAKQVVQDDPDICSPILFSNTVHNSCLGNISMEHKITGPSTMLLGSNHFLLSRLLLNEDKADLILTGSVEEYNDDLKIALKENGFGSTNIGEAAVVIGLVKSSEVDNTNIKITETFSFGIGGNPYEDSCKEDMDKVLIEENLQSFFEKHDVNAVILNDKDGVLGRLEQRIFTNKFPKVLQVDNVYKFFGNCIGCDLGIKVFLAKMCLERESIPATLSYKGITIENPKKLAVLSAEVTGNYDIILLEKKI